MATLELLIDASGMQRGAQQAEQALRTVQQASDRTATSVSNAGRSLSSAFQATGGSIQIAQGISQTAQAFGSLNTAAGLFSASRVLLEVGKTADDFRQLNGAVRTSGGLWSTLGTIIRTHPLLTIATVISAAASAMSLFGSNTSKAVDQMAEAAKKAAAFRGSISGIIGAAATGSDPTSAIDSYADRIRRERAESLFQYGQLRDDGSSRNVAPGVDYLYLRQADQIIPGIFDEKLKGGGIFGQDLPYGRLQTGQSLGYGSDYLISRGDFDRRILAISDANRQSAGAYQFGADPIRSSFAFMNGSVGPDNYVEQSADQRRRVEEEHAANIEAKLRRAAQYAEQIGQSFGSASADVILGASTLKQALAGLLQQGVRSGLSSAFGTVFAAGARALGATGTQQSQDFTAPGTGPALGQ